MVRETVTYLSFVIKNSNIQFHLNFNIFGATFVFYFWKIPKSTLASNAFFFSFEDFISVYNLNLYMSSKVKETVLFLLFFF